MLGSLLEWLTGRAPDGTGSDEGTDADDREDGSRWRPSRLDASVLFAHGKRVASPDDDVSELEEVAREHERDGGR